MIKTTTGFLLLAALPFLNGCISDAASLQIDGKEHSLSLVREQKWFWENRVELFVVVTRMPDCQRRHHLKSSSIGASTFDVYSADASTFYLRQGERTYAVETKTCEEFRDLTAAPPTSLGQKWGSFKESDGQFRFVDESAPAGQEVEKPDVSTAR